VCDAIGDSNDFVRAPRRAEPRFAFCSF